MKKKVLKVLALIVAIALIIGIGLFANALVGNPVSKFLATKSAEEHQLSALLNCYKTRLHYP